MTDESLPVPSDDVQGQGQSEQALLDAVMANSPIMEEAGVPLPNVETEEVDPVETDELDPESEETVEDVEEEVPNDYEEDDGEDDAQGASTQDDVLTTDDLDLDAMLSVKIDGEDTQVSFGDLVKGYTTEQSLSKKGRELGEARKHIEAERNEQLGNLVKISQAANAILGNGEQAFAKSYHEIEAQIEKARADGDTYELGELKDKREQAQKRYWNARQQREGLINAVEQQRTKAENENFQVQMQHFAAEIPAMIPDFDENVANSIREFALEHGIAGGLLDSVTDPAVVKFIDDYRRLKQGVSKGAAKRKAVPQKKALPTKKATPAAKKKQDAAKARRAKAFKEGSSADDQMAFLRDFASKSLNNI